MPGSNTPISATCPVTYRAGMLNVRQKPRPTCAKSRHTPYPRCTTSHAEIVGSPEIGDVPGHVPRGDVERPTEAEAHMREIPAHAVPALHHLPRRNRRVPRAGAVLDVAVDPFADGL